MAVPDNYKKLGTIGTAYKGDYDPNKQYKYLNEVYHEGSTYIALKDNPTGAPSNDGVNWKYSARGTSEGDTKDNTVSFTSNDTIDDDATSWTVVPKLISGIKHSTLVQYISQMFKNVRYLHKMYSELNSNMVKHKEITWTGTTTVGTNVTVGLLYDIIPSGSTYLGSVIISWGGVITHDFGNILLNDYGNKALIAKPTISQSNVTIRVTIFYI